MAVRWLYIHIKLFKIINEKEINYVTFYSSSFYIPPKGFNGLRAKIFEKRNNQGDTYHHSNFCLQVDSRPRCRKDNLESGSLAESRSRNQSMQKKNFRNVDVVHLSLVEHHSAYP